MVGIGIIGVGFMGWTHFAASHRISADGKITGRKLKGAEVRAIATRNPKKLAGDWTSIQGNFGPRAPKLDLSKVSGYADYRDLLNDPRIDLVDICLPNDQHEEVVCEALAAGKHVIVEKPIAVELKAADRMVKAAEKAERILMVAHVLPFFPQFAFAVDCVQSGKYGKLLAAHFRRVISSPDWSSDMSDFRNLGGWGIDLHIHDNHLIGLMCGVPKQVFATGILQEGLVNHVHSQYVLEDGGPAITSVSGGIANAGLAFSHGFELYLENATVLYSAATLGGEPAEDRPLTLIKGKKVTFPKLKGGSEWCSGFTAELQAAVDGVVAGTAPRLLSAELARDALKTSYAEAKSIATGKVVRI